MHMLALLAIVEPGSLSSVSPRVNKAGQLGHFGDWNVATLTGNFTDDKILMGAGGCICKACISSSTVLALSNMLLLWYTLFGQHG